MDYKISKFIGAVVFSFCFQSLAAANSPSIIEENWKIYFESHKTTNESVPADVYSLSELNIKAEVVLEILNQCAHRERLPVAQLYMSKLNVCPESFPQISELKSNFKQFLLTSSVDSPDYVKPLHSDLFSQLFVQIMIEEFASRDLFEVKTKSNSVGLCTGFINIGVCNQPEIVRPEIKRNDLKLLRLFSYIPVSSCRLGFNPIVLAQLMEKVLEAQGLYSKSRTSAIFVHNGQIQFASGANADSIIASQEFTRRPSQIRKDLEMNCSDLKTSENHDDR